VLPPPTEQQISFANGIFEKLNEYIDKNELEKALISKHAISIFISKYKAEL